MVPITGHLPSYVAGVLYRNGPGGYKVKRNDPKHSDFAVSHWFDGFATVHRFELESGTEHCSRALYSSHSLVDELIENARKTGKLDGITFGQKKDPCDTIYNKFKSVFKPTKPTSIETTSVNVTIRDPLPAELKHLKGKADSRKILTLGTDAARSEQIDADTLEPLGIASQTILHPSLTGPISAAHPAHDPETGDIYNYNLDFGPKCTYRVFRSSPTTGKTDILAEFSGGDTKPSYMHSFFITENFLVLCIWPAFFTGYGMPILINRNILDAIAFDPNSETTWVVIDRHHNKGVVKKFRSPPFFCFHTTNAWEEPASDGTVDLVCELVVFKDTAILHRLYYENLTSTGKNTANWLRDHPLEGLGSGLSRYRLPAVSLTKPTSTKGTAELLWHIEAPEAGDLPQINPRFATKPHRYVYSVLDHGKSSFLDAIGKTDTATKTCKKWMVEHHTPSEPVFVLNPDGTDEDDGAILSVVCDGVRGTSYLLCLDAKTMEELGRVDVGRAVGLGFHGKHVPATL